LILASAAPDLLQQREEFRGTDGELSACSELGAGGEAGAARQAACSSVPGPFVSHGTLSCVLCNAHSKVRVQRYCSVTGAGFALVAGLGTVFKTFSYLPNDGCSGAWKS